MYYQSSILGIQIIYNNAHNEKRIIKIGDNTRSDYEIHINTEKVLSTGTEHSDQIPFSLYYNSTINKRLDQHLIDVNPNTLILQYPKNLFNIFTIKDQIEINSSLKEVFKKDLYIQNGANCGYLHGSDSYLLENILLILSENIIIPEVVYKCICLISRIILKRIFRKKDKFESIHPSFHNLEKLITSIINDNFNYPTTRDIRKITNSTKRNFEAQIRSTWPSSLKVFQTELQFKSCLYKIMYTDESLQEIAFEHGFSEFTSLTRSIKLRTGFSAKVLRIKSKEGLLTLLPNLSFCKIIPQIESNGSIERYNIIHE
jgi:hypothetical protein